MTLYCLNFDDVHAAAGGSTLTTAMYFQCKSSFLNILVQPIHSHFIHQPVRKAMQGIGAPLHAVLLPSFSCDDRQQQAIFVTQLKYMQASFSPFLTREYGVVFFHPASYHPSRAFRKDLVSFSSSARFRTCPKATAYITRTSSSFVWSTWPPLQSPQNSDQYP